jgi:predicted N-acyltransferase
MSGYRVQVDIEIEQVDGVAWDALCEARPFATVYWLKFLEQVLADYQPGYLQLWQGKQLVAGAICQPQRHFHLSAYLKNKSLHKMASRVLAWLPPNACLLPLFLRDGLLVHSEVETAVWLPRLLAEIKKLSRQRWAPFTYLGNLTPTQGEYGKQQGFRIVPILQDSYLDIIWDNFDDYLSHLNAKRRYRVKSYMQNAEEAGVAMREVTLVAPIAPQIEALIRGVADKHDNAFLYRPDFLQRAQAYLQPGSAHTLVACEQNEPAACITLFCSGDELVAKWSGMNYGRTHETYAYHYMMIHIIKKAIELGIRRLDFGPTSYTLKRQLGCRLEDRVAGLKVGI